MLLGRNNVVVILTIFALAFLYVALKRPDIAKNIVSAIGKIIGGLFTVLWKILEALFNIISKMSVKAMVVGAIVIIAGVLIFLSLKGANCDCWPQDGKVYAPKSGEACLDPELPDDPPRACSYKYKSFTVCGIDEGNIARCGDE